MVDGNRQKLLIFLWIFVFSTGSGMVVVRVVVIGDNGCGDW